MNLFIQIPEWGYGALGGFITSLLASSVFDWFKAKMKPINEREKEDKIQKEQFILKIAKFLRESESDYIEFRFNKLEIQLNIFVKFAYLVASAGLFYLLQSGPIWLYWVLMINFVVSFASWLMKYEELKKKQKLQKQYDELERREHLPKF